VPFKIASNIRKSKIANKKSRESCKG